MLLRARLSEDVVAEWGQNMNELGELEKRIADALERIRSGVEGLSSGSAEDMVAASEADALAEQLSLVTADLAEASEALAAERAAKAEVEAELDALKNAPSGSGGSDAVADAELRTLRVSVQELQTANAELRRSALTGVTDPELNNRNLAADLEAVQAARLAELRDLDAILKTLTPVIEERGNA